MSHSKQKRLTLKQKIGIMKKLNDGVNGNQLALHYNVSKATISNIKKKKQEILDAYKEYSDLFLNNSKKTLSRNDRQFDQSRSSTEASEDECDVRETENEDVSDMDGSAVKSSDEDKRGMEESDGDSNDDDNGVDNTSNTSQESNTDSSMISEESSSYNDNDLNTICKKLQKSMGSFMQQITPLIGKLKESGYIYCNN